MKFDDLTDIEQTIVGEFGKLKTKPHLEVTILFFSDSDTKFLGPDRKKFASVRDIFNDPVYRKKKVGGIQIVALASKENNSQAIYLIESCIVDYGFQNIISGDVKRRNKVFLSVSGSGEESQILHDRLRPQIKSTLIKEDIIHSISEHISSKLVAIYIVISALFIASLFTFSAFTINGFSSELRDIELLENEIETLYESAPTLKSTEEKVDFLYRERILVRQLDSLQDRPRSKIEYTLNWNIFWKTTIFFVTVILTIFSLSRHFPTKNW